MQALPTFDLVLFGGTGDLAMRKLLPALYRRKVAGQMSPRFAHHRRGAQRPVARGISGAGRGQLPDRTWARTSTTSAGQNFRSRSTT